MNTIVTRFREGFKDVTNQLIYLLKEIPIKRQDSPMSSIDEYGNVTIHAVVTSYHWGKRTPNQTKTQIELKKKYDKISEIISVIFIKAPEDVLKRLHLADRCYRKWLQFEDSSSFTENRDENERLLKKCANEFEFFFNILESGGNGETILMPDTNAIAELNDPTRYRSIINENNFVFLLLPSVLGELDKLQHSHPILDFRNKVKKVNKIINGWRKQGSLLNGVLIDKTIRIRCISNEPNMESSLKWLDKNIMDDRIIASALEVQADNSTSRVILVTGDNNLKNKAEAAMIEFKGIEDIEEN